MTLGEANRRMDEMIGTSGVVWLVSSEASLWDERGLVEGWLSEHASQTDVVHFVRVSVYRYELP